MKKITLLLLTTLLHPQSLHANDSNLPKDKVQKLLSLSLVELMQIQMKTAGKTAEKIGEIPASVVLITREEIQRYGYTRLGDILQHVSGIYQIDFHGLGGEAYGVRGYLSTESRNITILINGVNQVADYNSSYLFSGIVVPVEAIDRIEIVRGPQSTIHGSGAFFGVINIITNDAENKADHQTTVSASVGSNGLQRRFVQTSHNYENGQIILNASYHRDDGVSRPYRDFGSNISTVSPSATTEGVLEKAETYVDVSANYRDLSVNLIHHSAEREGFISIPSTRTGTVRQPENTQLRLGYKKEFSPRWALEGHLTHINSDTNIDYDSMPNALWGKQREQSKAYESEITLNWKDHAHFDWISGAHYRHIYELSTHINIPALPVPTLQNATQQLRPDEAMAKWALFSQLNYYPNENWKWVAGLRLEQQLGYGVYSKYGNGLNNFSAEFDYASQQVALIPRLAVIYMPNRTHLFKLLYGKAINSPSFAQNTTWRSGANSLPSLSNEEIETLEFNYITDLTPNYTLFANLFYNRLDALFVNLTNVDETTGKYINVLSNSGSLNSRGIELGLQARPIENMRFELNLSYQKTEDEDFPDIKASYSPSLLGQLKWSYQFNRQWSLGLTGYYVSSMKVFYDHTLRNTDGSFGRYIGGSDGNNYFIMGANIRYQDWLREGTFLNLRINNLWNQEIIYPTYTRNLWMDKGIPGQERNFVLSLGYEF